MPVTAVLLDKASELTVVAKDKFNWCLDGRILTYFNLFSFLGRKLGVTKELD